MLRPDRIAGLFLAALAFGVAPPVQAADQYGVFELVRESSLPFAETNERLADAVASSGLVLHARHDVRLPDDRQQASVFVLTSPAYAEAASAESPRTASAQVLRLAIYTQEGKTRINMANPVAHAMVYYTDSPRYDALLRAAAAAADEMRALAEAVPGTTVREQQEPMRSEKHYRGYNGDGPARMMAKFRDFEESQLDIRDAPASEFAAVVDAVRASLMKGNVADASESEGWEIVSEIRLRDDVVYFGLTNPYIEDRMVQINSRFRKDGKSEASPYPGVDHVAALPTDLLVVRDGDTTHVLHYGQMWRMQLYFWDSGYRAFTANVGVPGKIADSIEDAIAR